jgi:hypothetical protein
VRTAPAPPGARPREIIFISMTPSYKISDFQKTNSHNQYFYLRFAQASP